MGGISVQVLFLKVFLLPLLHCPVLYGCSLMATAITVVKVQDDKRYTSTRMSEQPDGKLELAY